MKANKLKRGRMRIKASGIVRNMSVLLSVLTVAILAYFYLHSHPLKSVLPGQTRGVYRQQASHG